MPERFLYESMDALSEMDELDLTLPTAVERNLNPNLPLRPYQRDAFARFFRCMLRDFPGKEHPLHFLFHMATGSGKTLVMAGLILWLYEKGWRNFLFFVDKTHIIKKTMDNFLNPGASKHLFNGDVVINGRRVRPTAVDNFDSANPNSINLLFTTIQGLHSRLEAEQENSVSVEDFRRHKIAIISDESHHYSASTSGGLQLDNKPSWENTVQKILSQNRDNLLLEFTATPGYESASLTKAARANLLAKYRNKTMIRYDLARFRADRYSKDVILAQSDFGLEERMLQAVVLSEYRRKVAAKKRINLKPVVLFKSPKVADSEKSKATFRGLMDKLTAKQVAVIRKSRLSVIAQAFRFFDSDKISDHELAEMLRSEFHEDFCLSANEEKEQDKNQMLLNSLEDKNNRIRAVFAVQKLSEGWDVLNLFDIVRCHENRNSKSGGGNTAEAQLIGRGARYFPFVLPGGNDRYRRKFDSDLKNELRVLEEMHYHSKNDSRYIADLRDALVNEGVMDSNEKDFFDVKLKPAFKKTDFYKFGVIWLNERVRKNYMQTRSLADIGVARKNYQHNIAAGRGRETHAFSGGGTAVGGENSWDIAVKDIPRNVLESAIARNPFFAFDQLRRFFPHLSSMREFISSDKFLGGLKITLSGNSKEQSARGDYLAAAGGLLAKIEEEVGAQDCEFEGTRQFKFHPVHDVFKDKTLAFSSANPRAKADEDFNRIVAEEPWFGFDSAYCTSEEKDLVRMLKRKMPELRKQHDDIYLLRNEGHFAIYNFADGRGFEPDFAMFLRDKEGKTLVYQIFLEPKGAHLQEHDRWKAEFLDEITAEFKGKTVAGAGNRYRLVALPFYNSESENDFMKNLDAALAKTDANSAKK